MSNNSYFEQLPHSYPVLLWNILHQSSLLHLSHSYSDMLFLTYTLPVHWIITSFTFRYFSWHILYQCFKQPPHSLPDTSHDTLFISSLNNYLIHLQKLLMTYSVLVRWIFISFTSSSHATFCTSVLNNYLIYFQILFFKYSAPAMLFFEHLCHSHANTPFMSQSKLMLWAVSPFTFSYW